MIKIQPPSRQDQLIFQGLQRAIVENKAFIKINVHQLNKIGSPVFNPWENVLPMLIVVTLAIATMYIVNLTMGMLMLVVLCLIDIIIIPIILEPIITNRLVRRIVPKIEKFLSNEQKEYFKQITKGLDTLATTLLTIGGLGTILGLVSPLLLAFSLKLKNPKFSLSVKTK